MWTLDWKKNYNSAVKNFEEKDFSHAYELAGTCGEIINVNFRTSAASEQLLGLDFILCTVHFLVSCSTVKGCNCCIEKYYHGGMNILKAIHLNRQLSPEVRAKSGRLYWSLSKDIFKFYDENKMTIEKALLKSSDNFEQYKLFLIKD